MAELYQHPPLRSKRSIRVLDLVPAKHLDAPICCKLIETSVDEASPARLAYEALSYAWGSPHRDREISCDGKTLFITANCEAALRKLRHKSESRTLWVDSICINQSSVEERNGQVKMMADVYAMAEQVIVWLGEGHIYITTIFLAMRVLVKLQNNKFTSLLVSPFGKLLALSLRSGLQEILLSPWFLRIWTVQEVAFSRKAVVQCGRSKISWENLKIAFDLLESAYHEPQIQSPLKFRSDLRMLVSLRRMGERIDDLQVTEQGMAYYRLLRFAGLNNATDPRDKVYAIYGILNFLGIPMPDPDYAKTVVDVWEEAAVSIIQKTGSLLILCAACGSQCQDGLPSWVPDWTSAPESEQLSLTSPGLYLASGAAGQSTVSCDSSRLRRQLDLTGMQFAKVKVRGPSMAPMPDVNDIDMSYVLRDEIDRTRTFSAWARIAFRIENMVGLLCDNDEWWSKIFSSQDVTGEPPLIAFYRIITRDKIPGTTRYKDWRSAFIAWTISMLSVPGIPYDGQSEDLLSSYDLIPWNSTGPPFGEFWSRNRIARDAIAAIDFQEGFRYAENFHDEIKFHHAQQAFFLTTTGHMGIANHMVQENDIVALFAGGNFPMIIRPDGEHYRLISPSYINGIMQGEAWPGDVPFEEMEKFTLI